MYGRRRFLKNALIWLPAGTAALGALLAACSDSSDSADESALSDCSLDGTCDTSSAIHDAIANNHGHSVSLSQAEVDAGKAVSPTLTMGGADDHIHTVTLTAAMIADIKAGMQLHVDSSNEPGHSHCVTFNCSTGGGGGGGYERKA